MIRRYLALSFLFFSPIKGNDEIETIYNQTAIKQVIIHLSELSQEPTKAITQTIKKFRSRSTNLEFPAYSTKTIHNEPSNNQANVQNITNTLLTNLYNHYSGNKNPFLNFKKQGLFVGGTTVIPPDTQGAVGISDIVMTLNDRIVIQNKSNGLVKRTINIATFFRSLSTDIFDPRVMYDQFNQRWIITAGANPEASNAGIVIAVSKTNDPNGSWDQYFIASNNPINSWGDQPTLGYNANWLTIQANTFDVHSGNFTGVLIFAINKARLFTQHPSLTFTTFKINIPTNGITPTDFSVVPARTFDNTTTTQYLLEDLDGSTGKLGLYTITGAVDSPTLSRQTIIHASTRWGSNQPFINKGFAPQKGTKLRISTNDSRLESVVFCNGSLWATHTIFLPANNPTRCSVQWWQINPNGSIMQQGLIDNPTATAKNGGFFYAYPSIAVNQNNAAFIGYSIFSSNIYASAAFSYRLATDRANTMRTQQIYQAGKAPYTLDFSQGEIRWGDYSNAVVDPVNNTDLWTIQEYAENNNLWGVAWAKFTPPTK